MQRVSPLLLTALLFLATPALAEEPGGDGAAVKRLLTRARTIGEPGNARPTVFDPVQSLHVTAFPMAALGFWAQGTGFSLSRRTAVYDLEGGASLLLDEGVHLTASYRMLGIDLGYDADSESANIDPNFRAPFLGLAFDF